jgi:hypothetical protein
VFNLVGLAKLVEIPFTYAKITPFCSNLAKVPKFYWSYAQSFAQNMPSYALDIVVFPKLCQIHQVFTSYVKVLKLCSRYVKVTQFC